MDFAKNNNINIPANIKEAGLNWNLYSITKTNHTSEIKYYLSGKNKGEIRSLGNMFCVLGKFLAENSNGKFTKETFVSFLKEAFEEFFLNKNDIINLDWITVDLIDNNFSFNIEKFTKLYFNFSVNYYLFLEDFDYFWVSDGHDVIILATETLADGEKTLNFLNAFTPDGLPSFTPGAGAGDAFAIKLK